PPDLHSFPTRRSSDLFAMKPVVYDFAINNDGTVGSLLPGDTAPMPAGYYAAVVPRLVRMDSRSLTPSQVAEMDAFAVACQQRPRSEEHTSELQSRSDL